ncbi:MAG: hypothetical protein ABSB15_29300 [Bryobacteraceae bacterium]|jgi:hypothetical protein
MGLTRIEERHNWPAMLVERPCMGTAHGYERITAPAAGALLLLGLSLGGCATSSAGSSLMDARAQSPAPPKAGAYLPVEDLPPKREMPAMTPDERSKLKNELTAARDRQAVKPVKKPEGAARAEPVKP